MRKAFVGLASLFLVGLSTTILPLPAVAQVDLMRMSGAGKDIRRIKLADGVYQFMTMRDSYVRQLNSIVIINRDDVLVFDTNTRPSTARLILAEIHKLTNKPVRFVVNSHSHPDHWSGTEVYDDAFPGLQVIATTQTCDLMYSMADGWAPRFAAQLAARREAARNAPPASPEEQKQAAADLVDYASLVEETKRLRRVFPTQCFDESLSFTRGGREFRILNVTGDNEGTAVLYLPKEKILLAGDAVSYPIPYISYRPSQHAKSLRMLSQLDVYIIVPGHGPAFHDKAFLLLELALIEHIFKATKDALRTGMTDGAEIQKVVAADAFRDRFAHGDKDLEARFDARVKAVVGYVVTELD